MPEYVPGLDLSKKIVSSSKSTTKKAINGSVKKTKKAINSGKEDIESAKNIIKEEMGYQAYAREENKRAYFIRVAKLFGPFGFLILWYIFLLWWPNVKSGTDVASTSMIYLLPSFLGKESMIPAALSAGGDAWIVALTFTFVDAFLVLLVALNFDYIKQIPNIGRVTTAIERSSRKFLDKDRWLNLLIKQFATIGLFFFVMLPFQGGGGANGAIVGRVMGLKPLRVIIPVILGSAVESFALAYSASFFLSLIPDWTSYVGYIIVGLALIFYLIAWMKKARERKRKEETLSAGALQ